MTAPDGGPTSLLLPPGSTLDPFFGTSAAAPAAAAIAALMMQANPQLKNNPRRLANFMEFTAISDGESASKKGFRFLNGPGAVSDAASSRVNFFDPPTSAGPTLLAAAISQPFGSVSTGALIQFQLTFNEALKVTGTPTFTLNDGGKASYDAAASQPANATLVFDYTVTSAQHTGDLEVTGFVAASGKIADSAGHVPVLSAMFNLPTGLSVNSPVAVTSVTSDKAAQEPSGTTVHISMTLNDPVSVTNGASGGLTLALDNGGTAFYDFASSTATRLVSTTSSPGRADARPHGICGRPRKRHHHRVGRLQRQPLCRDRRCHRRAGGGGFRDQRGAVAVGDAQPGATVKLEIDFSQPISVNTSGGSPTLTLNNGATAFYDAGATASADVRRWSSTTPSPPASTPPIWKSPSSAPAAL